MSILIGPNTYNKTRKNTYSLSTLAFGDPDDYVKISTPFALVSKASGIYAGVVSGGKQVDYMVNSVSERRTVAASLSLSCFREATVADVRAQASKLLSFINSSQFEDYMRGRSEF